MKDKTAKYAKFYAKNTKKNLCGFCEIFATSAVKNY